mmetsp:Transcript_25572/g.12109  ORF Transcript_25572/g.12109 Transcript_25572/m.12109 type:complete len:129 (+) Transcript_25572:339-725(+)
MLENINNILNGGEVPNLIVGEDRETVLEQIREDAIKQKSATNDTQIWDFFVERCKNNLHIALCMSPIGMSLRNSLRNFPALVTCCSIDWFTQWPDQALYSVAKNFFTYKNLVEEELEHAVVEVCLNFH